jgi:hypothetical protein
MTTYHVNQKQNRTAGRTARARWQGCYVRGDRRPAAVTSSAARERGLLQPHMVVEGQLRRRCEDTGWLWPRRVRAMRSLGEICARDWGTLLPGSCGNENATLTGECLRKLAYGMMWQRMAGSNLFPPRDFRTTIAPPEIRYVSARFSVGL